MRFRRFFTGKVIVIITGILMVALMIGAAAILAKPGPSPPEPAIGPIPVYSPSPSIA